MITATFTSTMLIAPVLESKPSKQSVVIKLFHLVMCLKPTCPDSLAVKNSEDVAELAYETISSGV